MTVQIFSTEPQCFPRSRKLDTSSINANASRQLAWSTVCPSFSEIVAHVENMYSCVDLGQYIGLDLNDPRALDGLKRLLEDDAPVGFAAWLDRNLSQFDPIVRSWRRRGSLSPGVRDQYSYKCWDDQCVHYIYGFSNREDRDRHTREHAFLAKRDSGLSVGSTPPLHYSDQSAARSFHDPPSSNSPGVPHRSGSTLHLAPINTGLNQSRDHRDSLRSYSFVSDQASHQARGSVDSEVDPLLPPLKRSRVGQSKLESIEELKLVRDIGQCLRCRVMNHEVIATAPPTGDLLPSLLLKLLTNSSVTRTTHARSVPTRPI